MEEIIRSLGKLNEQITAARRNSAVLEGNREVLSKRLKDEFNIKSTQEANKVIAAMEKDIAVSRKRIEEKFKAIKEKYEWED